MNGKILFLVGVSIAIAVWLWFGWQDATQRSTTNTIAETAVAPTASATPPVRYVATSSATEVVLDVQASGEVATLRGLGYAALPLQATTTVAGTVYRNTNELVRVIERNDQLRVWVADTALFNGVRASSTTGE